MTREVIKRNCGNCKYLANDEIDDSGCCYGDINDVCDYWRLDTDATGFEEKLLNKYYYACDFIERAKDKLSREIKDNILDERGVCFNFLREYDKYKTYIDVVEPVLDMFDEGLSKEEIIVRLDDVLAKRYEARDKAENVFLPEADLEHRADYFHDIVYIDYQIRACEKIIKSLKKRENGISE